MELGPPDESGRARPVPIPGSEFDVPATCVIAAIGQSVDAAALNAADLTLSKWGIAADPEDAGDEPARRVRRRRRRHRAGPRRAGRGRRQARGGIHRPISCREEGRRRARVGERADGQAERG